MVRGVIFSFRLLRKSGSPNVELVGRSLLRYSVNFSFALVPNSTIRSLLSFPRIRIVLLLISISHSLILVSSEHRTPVAYNSSKIALSRIGDRVGRSVSLTV